MKQPTREPQQGDSNAREHHAVLPPQKTAHPTLDHHVGRRHNLRLDLVKRA